jgi:hypothetical protein
VTVLALALLLQADPQDRPELWLYCSTNLQVDASVEKLDAIWRRAAKAGYTKVLLADSKMAKLGDLGENAKRYFRNLERARKLAGELQLEIIPALFHVGYSNAMLWHDPNLAEGLPVKGALFEVKAGEARLVPDPPVALGPRFGFKDENVAIEGGEAVMRDHAKQARFTFRVKVAPFRCYHVSVRIKTEGYSAAPEVKALGGGRMLQWEHLGVKPAQDWREHHVVFNSLESEEVTVYFGVWDEGKGTLRWKDWKIEEAGPVNVLRRPGAPFVVDGHEEGKDYERVEDPRLGRRPWKGEFQSWHEPVPIRTRLPDGTRLRVSWYHPAVVHEGQVMACVSEPRTRELLADEARRVREALGAKGYMMSHDEIRTLNWDESCRRRNLDAGAILAENARECVKLLEGATAYVWSDMFDPHHNAHKDYYLVRGDLAGSWEGLPKDVVIVNWNFGERDKSLAFFAGRGHRQVIAGYYDGPVEQVKRWLASAAKVKGVVGVMYTTWRNDYDGIEAFARACRE